MWYIQQREIHIKSTWVFISPQSEWLRFFLKRMTTNADMDIEKEEYLLIGGTIVEISVPTPKAFRNRSPI